ncbi:MAG: SCO family protein [Rhodospirillales bacterium]|nr:SCO family protein [Rhodospirillales bacterium]
MSRIALLLALLLALPARAAPSLGDIRWDQHPGSQVPTDTPFRGADGRPITLGSAMDGRPTVLDLGYFHCTTLCGVVRNDLLSALAQSGLRAGTDFTLVAVSIDPAETPQDAAHALSDEQARYQVPGDRRAWHYLTGTTAAIERVTQAVGFRARFDAATKQFYHPAGLVILTPAGTVSSYVLGVGYQAGDVRAALLRAHEGGIAKASLPILLLCFHFDPTTGRYTLAIWRVLQLGGALTILIVGGTIALALRRERTR